MTTPLCTNHDDAGGSTWHLADETIPGMTAHEDAITLTEVKRKRFPSPEERLLRSAVDLQAEWMARTTDADDNNFASPQWRRAPG